MAKSTEIMLGFDEVLQLLVHCDPKNSVIVRGQPGIGKTSLAQLVADKRTELMTAKERGVTEKALAEVKEYDKQNGTRTFYELGRHYVSYVFDCTCADVGDFVIPNVQEVRGVNQVVYAPNAVFGVGSDNPVIVLFDEFGKAPKPVQDAALPAILEHRIGQYFLPEGSQVIATTNLVSDGVGDMIQAHAYNRVTCLTMRNPTADEWTSWAMNAGVSSVIIAVAKQFPMFFQMYTEGKDAEANPYIFNPIKHPERMQFVSPRSLVKAGSWIDRRGAWSMNSLLAVLTGCVGEAAARDMLSLVTMADSLPSPAEVIKDPDGVRLPDSGPAQLLLGLNVIHLATVENANDIIGFVMRLKPEVAATLMVPMFSEAFRGNFLLARRSAELAQLRMKYSVAA